MLARGVLTWFAVTLTVLALLLAVAAAVDLSSRAFSIFLVVVVGVLGGWEGYVRLSRFR